jgi:hypothetical protein
LRRYIESAHDERNQNQDQTEKRSWEKRMWLKKIERHGNLLSGATTGAPGAHPHS